MDPNEKPSKEILNAWHADRLNWKLGIFYFNKKDKRIFLRKRIGYLGWTVNFANPFSYLVLIGISAFSIIVTNLILWKLSIL